MEQNMKLNLFSYLNSKVTKIKKYVDNSKELNQKNTFGDNKATIK